MSTKKTDQAVEINPLVLVQLVLELVVVVGYVVGALGGLFLAYYALVAWWLVPVVIANILLALSEESGSEKLDLANFLCALLTLVPVLGLLPATIGIILSLVAIFKIFPHLTTQVSTPSELTVSAPKSSIQKPSKVLNQKDQIYKEKVRSVRSQKTKAKALSKKSQIPKTQTDRAKSSRVKKA